MCSQIQVEAKVNSELFSSILVTIDLAGSLTELAGQWAWESLLDALLMAAPVLTGTGTTRPGFQKGAEDLNSGPSYFMFNITNVSISMSTFSQLSPELFLSQ